MTETSVNLKKNKVLLGIVVLVVFIVIVGAVLLLRREEKVESGITIPSGALVLDDFDDESLGTNLGTPVGTMGGYPPDPGNEYCAFVPTSTGLAIQMTIDVPQGGWSGYWCFLKSGDISTDPILVSIGSGYDLSGYTTLKMAVKASKAMSFKVELQDTLQFSNAQNAARVFKISDNNFRNNTAYRDIVLSKYGKSIENLSRELFGRAPEDIERMTNADVHTATDSHNGKVHRTAKTEWEVIEIPLVQFVQQAGSLNLKDIRQINIVFEGPVQGKLWIDWIAFE
ncbi:MAG: hypothetical protein QXX33_04810 [Candidatus Hadarchaeales archaeon]